MTETEFFQRLQNQFDQNLPFVAYRLPEEQQVKTFLQKNSEEYTTTNFTESGFVFSPFVLDKSARIIPEEYADMLEWKISDSLMGEKGVSREVPETGEDPVAKAHHVELVERGIEALRSGKMEKVVLSRREEIQLSDPDPLRYFRDLIFKYPGTFVYLWYHPNTGCWLAASPEILLKISGKQLTTMALAGTQKYRGSMEVSWGEKEKQEQQFVTDEILGKLGTFTSQVNVSEVKTVKAGSLLHLRTDIEARINGPDNIFKDLLHALHPTPAVCGLPKEKARDFIIKEEGYDREFYTGFLGELNLQKSRNRSRHKRNVEELAYRSVKKETALYVNLRCMKIEEDRAVLFVGGGITRDSRPLDEWQETVQKAETMKAALFS